METIVNRYKTNGAWKENIKISEEEWIHLEKIIESAGALNKRVPYEKLIYTKFFK